LCWEKYGCHFLHVLFLGARSTMIGNWEICGLVVST
jgi:hypothetical protein